jgi:sirohydrochlorin cobaltochelatase
MTPTSPNTAVVLFAHGSRDPLWRLPIDAVAAEMRQQAPGMAVHCAFLELMEPSLSEVVDSLVTQGHRHVRVVPLFLGMGRHAREDLPQLCQALRERHAGLVLTLQKAMGEQSALTRCMAQIALEP